MDSGWYEFFVMPDNTTHIAYVYSDQSVYLPEGVDIREFEMAESMGNAFRLVREDEIEVSHG